MSDIMHDSTTSASPSASLAAGSIQSSLTTSPEKDSSSARSQENTAPRRRLQFHCEDPDLDERDSASSDSSVESRLLSSESDEESNNSDDGGCGNRRGAVWKVADFPATITFRIRYREQERMTATVNEINAVLSGIKRRCGIIGSGKISRGVIVKYFLHLYIATIARYVEEMRVTHGAKDRPFALVEVIGFFRVVLLSMYYRMAPGVLYDKGPSVFGPMNDAYTCINRARFMRIWALLQKRRLSKDTGMDSFLNELEELIGNTCRVCFVADHATVSLDDDKLPFTKHMATDLGLKTFKIKERCSAVQHCLVSLNTRLFQGGYLNRVDESSRDCVNNLLGAVTGKRTAPMASIPATLTVTMDRGYSHVAFDKSVSITTLTTVKRGRNDFPFTFTKGNNRFREGQRGQSTAGRPQRVRLEGAQALYYATTKENGLAVAWRDRERVTLLQTTDATVLGNDWDYIPLDKTALKEIEFQSSTPAYKQYALNRVMLTGKQRTADWFVCRRFQLTSTVVYPLMRIWSSGHAYAYNEHVSNQSERVRVRVDLGKVEALSKLILGQSCSSGALECRKTFLLKNFQRSALNDLVKERKLNGARSQWTKGELVNYLVASISASDRLFAPLHDFVRLEQAMLDSWFPKPKRTKEFRIGLKNEIRIRNEIKQFINSQENASWIAVDVQEVGLSHAADMHAYKACASLDGIILLNSKTGNLTSLCGLEIKTRTGEKIVPKFREIANVVGPYRETRVGFNAADQTLFLQTVVKADFRMQLLHHVSVTRLDYILYVESTIGEILYAVLVDFQAIVQNAYLDQFLRPMGEIVSSLTNRIERADRDSEIWTKLQFNYSVDAWTIQQQLELTQALRRMRDEYKAKGIQLPPARAIRPAIVSAWNSLKGGTDVYSRLMSHVRPRLQGTLMGQIILRMFAQLVVNAERIQKLSTLSSETLASFHSIKKMWKHMNINSTKNYLLELFKELERAFLTVDSNERQRDTPNNTQESNRRTMEDSPSTSFAQTKRRREVSITADMDMQRHVPTDANSPSRGISKLGLVSPKNPRNANAQFRGRCRVCCYKCSSNQPHGFKEGSVTSTFCLVCTQEEPNARIVYLCDKVREPFSKTCFDIFHSTTCPKHMHPFLRTNTPATVNGSQ